MLPLYTEAEFAGAKRTDLLPLKCKQCNKTFYITKTRVMQALNPNRTRGHADFCSLKCVGTSKGPPLSINCTQCNKSFEIRPSQFKKHKNHFCTISCSAKYSNAHKTKGSKISKLELLLQSKLPIMYPSLDFRFNKTDAINRELDIYIPALKLAIEINGIFHYEPIFGIKKLINTQNSDKLKLSSCLDKNIELHIIDV